MTSSNYFYLIIINICSRTVIYYQVFLSHTGMGFQVFLSITNNLYPKNKVKTKPNQNKQKRKTARRESHKKARAVLNKTWKQHPTIRNVDGNRVTLCNMMIY